MKKCSLERQKEFQHIVVIHSCKAIILRSFSVCIFLSLVACYLEVAANQKPMKNTLYTYF